ncbi:hypothetical protein [Pantoea sp.]|jgi:chromosome segregation ATPase|uniref:hypothetical protein n=1 Tax=Pantoea sp. TaxID=69393 RepID=UPI0031D1C874
MTLRNKLQKVRASAERRIHKQTQILHRCQQQTAAISARITALEQAHQAAQQLSQSFVCDGETHREAILEQKARQATLRRKMATLMLELEALRQQQSEVEQTRSQASTARQALERRQQRLELRARDLRRQATRRLQNQIDDEIEEQCSWPR